MVVSRTCILVPEFICLIIVEDVDGPTLSLTELHVIVPLYVETVCLLSKIRSAPHIDIDLDMTELDVTAAETKATYEEIKAYVLEHTGLKVSCLYIAQVKAKHGIIERDCYNKSKTEGNRVPKCPPEKERAIEEALRHFRMIP